MIPLIEVRTALGDEPDVLVGTCRFNLRRGHVSTSFSYDDAYLASPLAYAIDPLLPFARKSGHFDGLPGCLCDSSPDRWGRHLFDRRAQEEALANGEPIRTLDEVDYLLGVFDASRQGALRLRVPGCDGYLSPKEEIPPVVELKRLAAAASLAAQGKEGRQQLKELLDAGSASLGGARPKASVVDDGKLYLAKFSHPGDEWDVMAWEKTCLDVARAAGMEVPNARVVRLGRESALLVERFDREGSLLRGRRVPYVSAMTLVGARDGATSDYAEVAEAAVDWCDDSVGALRSLFERVALSVALHNTDDHLRNLGFLRVAGSWRLAPVFDVNIEPDGRRERVTAVYGETGAGEVAGLKELAGICGLSGDEASQCVGRVVSAARRWRPFATRNGCSKKEMSILGRVVDERCNALDAAFH